MFEVNVYIETSMKGPGKREGWYAAVVEYTKKDGTTVTREDIVFEKETTYHRSVLCAMAKALKRLNASCGIVIYMDAEIIKNNVENNLQRWRENGFLNIKGKPIKNQEEWKTLAELLNGHEIEFCITKRHFYSSWMQNEAKIRKGKEDG